MLNEQLPHNLIQISSLKFFFCGAFNPLSIKILDISLNLSEIIPLGSPSENLSPSVCLIIPGSKISQAG